MKLLLYVKGNAGIAQDHAQKHGINTTIYKEVGFGQTILECDNHTENIQKIAKWYGDESYGHTTPYPLGTLLFWNIVS